MNEKIRKLNEEITSLEEEYWIAKCDYEMQKANLLLGTDFSGVIGKAKPTVAEKDSWIETQIGELKLNYRMIRATLESQKRLFQVMLKELGED